MTSSGMSLGFLLFLLSCGFLRFPLDPRRSFWDAPNWGLGSRSGLHRSILRSRSAGWLFTNLYGAERVVVSGALHPSCCGCAIMLTGIFTFSPRRSCASTSGCLGICSSGSCTAAAGVTTLLMNGLGLGRGSRWLEGDVRLKVGGFSCGGWCGGWGGMYIPMGRFSTGKSAVVAVVRWGGVGWSGNLLGVTRRHASTFAPPGQGT
ncbi:hypothetical protein R3P38DRAFT_1321264 [Favolaschia claudopus]|uniref:Secreted protein n=1 Tax=Favolaschia claudopus TaxID=2862362 RepID=A0AAW0AUY9_9AGAR